jgi:putative ABC transport system permease protein
MLKNYLLISLRNLRKHKGYSIIDTVGLGLGLAVCLLIGLFVQDELAFDRFHEDANRIFRVVQDEVEGDGLAWSGPQMGLKLEQDFPQIESMMRLIDGGIGYGTSALISYEDEAGGQVRRFEEPGFLYADPGFFSFFSFPLLSGDAAAVLSRPGTVVITESMARKYFGEADPIGEMLLLSNRFPLEVTGVAADPPETSHLTFRFVTSYQTFYANRPENISGEINSFWWPPTHTYVKLRNEAAAEALDAELLAFSERHRDPDDASRMTLRLQPLTDIWLGPNYGGQQRAGGSIVYVYLFSAIALFVLLLACVNFTNLATARATQRAREVGVRKVVGAARTQLMVQFLSESVLLSLAALILGLTMAALSLPFFNDIAGKQLSIPFANGGLWMILLGLATVTGLAAGSYPAVFLSSFQPAAIIVGTGGRSARGTGLRKGLVIFQFTVSVVLLTSTAVVYQQLQYVHQSRLDFDGDEIVVLPGAQPADFQNAESGDQARYRYEALEQELQQQSIVRQVTMASSRPGWESYGQRMVWEADGIPRDPNRQIPVQFVGKGFFEMLGLEMVTGRRLRAENPVDLGTRRPRKDERWPPILDDRGFVLNETAVRRLGWTPEEALGQRMRFYVAENDNIYQDHRGTVVGVVQDYHTASLHEPIGPIAYMPPPQYDYAWLGYMLVRLAPGNAQDALRTLEQVWERVIPDRPFAATFLDESLDDLYHAEIRLGKVIAAFSLLAVIIACLGLFGLAAFTAERRTKEIGIRRVLGASVRNLVALLTKDFLVLVLVAAVVAVPVAYYAMIRWLSDFAYRISMSPLLFIGVTLLALVVAFLTVGFQAYRAATLDPVKTLRYE